MTDRHEEPLETLRDALTSCLADFDREPPVSFVTDWLPRIERAARQEAASGLRTALEALYRNGYQPMYNGRPSCPFCSAFVDDEETHTPDCVLRVALSQEPTPDERPLDAAWAEAEAVLPNGWDIYEVTRSGSRWLAVAGRAEALWGGRNSEAAHGETPAEALHALAASLSAAGE